MKTEGLAILLTNRAEAPSYSLIPGQVVSAFHGNENLKKQVVEALRVKDGRALSPYGRVLGKLYGFETASKWTPEKRAYQVRVQDGISDEMLRYHPLPGMRLMSQEQLVASLVEAVQPGKPFPMINRELVLIRANMVAETLKLRRTSPAVDLREVAEHMAAHIDSIDKNADSYLKRLDVEMRDLNDYRDVLIGAVNHLTSDPDGISNTPHVFRDRQSNAFQVEFNLLVKKVKAGGTEYRP